MDQPSSRPPLVEPNLEAALKVQLNQAFEGRFQRQTEYQSVQVLLLYWEEQAQCSALGVAFPAGFLGHSYTPGRFCQGVSWQGVFAGDLKK
jgi:hypothetical protein